MSGKSILVTAPSGAGKTTLVKMLLKDYDQFGFLVSTTTRSPRPNEVDGVDYYFISNQQFQDNIDHDRYLEWEEVYKGIRYGTLKSELQRIFDQAKTPLFDIDVTGALNVKKTLNHNVFTIFISPPDMKTLEERLRNRKTETEDKLKMRLNKAQCEMKFQNFFDKKIINNNLEETYSEFKKAIFDYLKIN